jgi:acyl carrier protein
MPEYTEVATIVASALECDPAELTLESGLNRHPRWDSLAHLEVVVSLENEFGVVIDQQVIRRTLTIELILELLRSGDAMQTEVH